MRFSFLPEVFLEVIRRTTLELACEERANKHLSTTLHAHQGIRCLVKISWVSPCPEQGLVSIAPAVHIACNITFVLVIHSRKPKHHAIRDMHCGLHSGKQKNLNFPRFCQLRLSEDESHK